MQEGRGYSGGIEGWMAWGLWETLKGPVLQKGNTGHQVSTPGLGRGNGLARSSSWKSDV
jgi:hypothetical protein